MKYKTIDLCAGIGGIRRGFEMTGRFENVLSAEIDEYAARTYEHLYQENPRNDLASARFKKKVQNTEYDVLLAGFPCQTFSGVGKQAGFADKTKGTVFYANICHFLRIFYKKDKAEGCFFGKCSEFVVT